MKKLFDRLEREYLEAVKDDIQDSLRYFNDFMKDDLEEESVTTTAVDGKEGRFLVEGVGMEFLLQIESEYNYYNDDDELYFIVHVCPECGYDAFSSFKLTPISFGQAIHKYREWDRENHPPCFSCEIGTKDIRELCKESAKEV